MSVFALRFYFNHQLNSWNPQHIMSTHRVILRSIHQDEVIEDLRWRNLHEISLQYNANFCQMAKVSIILKWYLMQVHSSCTHVWHLPVTCKLKLPGIMMVHHSFTLCRRVMSYIPIDRSFFLEYCAFYNLSLGPIVAEILSFMIFTNVQSYHPCPLPQTPFYRWRWGAINELPQCWL